MAAAAVVMVACSAPGEGEGEGDAGEGEGEGDVGEGEGEGEGECGTDCAGLLYTECTCGVGDPCAWAGDGVCDEDGCIASVGSSFSDPDCDVVAPSTCDLFTQCVSDGLSGFDDSQPACDGSIAISDALRGCAETTDGCADGGCYGCFPQESQFCGDAFVGGDSWFFRCSAAGPSVSACVADGRIREFCTATAVDCSSCAPSCGMFGGCPSCP